MFALEFGELFSRKLLSPRHKYGVPTQIHKLYAN